MRVAHVVVSDSAGPALDSTHRHVHSDARDVRGQLVVLDYELGVALPGGHLQAPLLNMLHLIVENVLLLLLLVLALPHTWSTDVGYWAHVVSR